VNEYLPVIVFIRRSVGIRQWNSAGELSPIELISTISVGKRIVAGYSSCRLQRDWQFARCNKVETALTHD
jgi:hypothetical protein